MNRRCIVPVLLALLGGCVAERPDLSEVSALSQEVLGAPATLLEGPEDRSADAAVRDLLARELSVDDAIRVALLRNMELQAIYEDLGIAEANLVAATLPQNPTFHSDVLLPDRSPRGTALELEFSQDLLSIITIPARRAVADAQLARSRALVTAKVIELAADVRAAYYHLLGALQTSEALARAAEAAGASLEYAEALHRAGNLSDLELAQQRAQRADTEVELSRSALDVIDARERLTALMGLWGEETRWTVPALLPDLPAAEPALEQLESLAMEQRLDLEASRNEAEALARSLDMQRSYRWTPGISVGAAADRDTDGQWSMGPHLELTLPLYDHGQADVARVSAQLRQVEKRYAALAVNVRAEVRRVHGRLLALGSLARGYRDRLLPARRDVVQRALEHYGFMLIGTFQLLEAKQAELAAERDYVRALEEYWVTRAELSKVLGGRAPEHGGR